GICVSASPWRHLLNRNMNRNPQLGIIHPQCYQQEEFPLIPLFYTSSYPRLRRPDLWAAEPVGNRATSSPRTLGGTSWGSLPATSRCIPGENTCSTIAGRKPSNAPAATTTQNFKSRFRSLR